jgi:hypothetical protein
MAEEFIARGGKQSTPSLGNATSNIENLAAAMAPPAPATASQRAMLGRRKECSHGGKWIAPFCGDIDMRIARDGTWFYYGTPITRPALVRLFSTILRKDPEGCVLVSRPSREPA